MKIEAGWHDIPNEIYHHDPKYRFIMTNSGLKEIEKTPAHWLSWRTTPPKPPTPQMAFGSLYHMLILQPDVFDQNCYIYNGRKAGKAYDKFKKAVPENSYVADIETFDILNEMAEVIQKHEAASALINFEGAKVEQSGFFQDPKYGFWWSIRPDILISSGGLRIVCDLKTTIDASEEGFARASANFKYFWQGYLYLTGAEILTGDEFSDFVFICQEKTPPYAVATYRMARDSLEMSVARKQIEPLRKRFAKCIEKDQWPAYPDKLIDLEIPKWALTFIEENL